MVDLPVGSCQGLGRDVHLTDAIHVMKLHNGHYTGGSKYAIFKVSGSKKVWLSWILELDTSKIWYLDLPEVLKAVSNVMIGFLQVQSLNLFERPGSVTLEKGLGSLPGYGSFQKSAALF